MAGVAVLLLAGGGVRAQSPDVGTLADLSLEELANLQVTSVSKQRESLSDAPASIFVITAEDIRRTGATTIPEILRLAPNLQVARRDSVQYSITARGFNNAVGNKLLVLMDGRTIYTPLFSGVFWEMQDTFIDDIERVEVISGPGATLWGANAVNGVINIITRSSTDTRATLLTGDIGSNERGAAVRSGGQIGDSGSIRAYAKVRDWDQVGRDDGIRNLDEWDRWQVGFRTDWEGTKQTLTLQGDAYRGRTTERGAFGLLEIPPVSILGMNVLGRWTRQFDNGSNLRVQAYWDRTRRREIIQFQPEAEIFDVEIQHGIPVGAHQILWGGGYRHASDEVEDGLFNSFIPDERTLNWENVFVQDEITIADSLTATLGIKLEWNDYTGMEYLPNARLAWKLTDQNLIWGSFSRAVRAPSRFDREIFSPAAPPFVVAGGPEFRSEVVQVIDIGLRGQPVREFSYSITAFYHDWNHLRSGTSLPLPITLANNIEGESYGVEAWGAWQVTDAWRLTAGGTILDKDLEFKPGTSDTVGTNNATLHNDPDFQWMVRSSFELPGDWELDLHLRGVDALPVQPVPAYTELDARLAWRPREFLELSVTGRNLLHDDHPEFGAEGNRSEFERSVLLGLRVSL